MVKDRVVKYNPSEHYPMLESWWLKWAGIAVKREHLGNLGFICVHNDRPIVCAWLMPSDSAYTYVHTFISNPNSTWQEREFAIKYLLDTMTQIAKDLGYKKLLIIPEKEFLKDKIEKSGFETYGNKIYLCMKEI